MGKRKFLSLILGFALAGVTTVVCFLIYLDIAMNRPGSHTDPVSVFISREQSPLRILSDKGLISSPRLFKIHLYLKGYTRSLKAGEYKFPAKASMAQILDMLIKGDVIVHQITFPEGLSSYQIIDLLNAEPALLGTVQTIPPNGSLLPETYSYVYGDTRESIIRRMEKAMDHVIDPLLQSDNHIARFKSRDQALSMACLIEKETHLGEERGIVSSVFHNRLKKRMRMQSDPTVHFALTEGRYKLPRPLTFKDLKIEHPSNTYVVYGLPPVPICNPGRDAIRAAFFPEETDFLYFVARPDGGHIFAKTVQEHNENAAKWRAHIKVERKKLRQRQK